MKDSQDDLILGPSRLGRRNVIAGGLALAAAGGVGLRPKEADASMLGALLLLVGYGAAVGLAKAITSRRAKMRGLQSYMSKRETVMPSFADSRHTISLWDVSDAISRDNVKGGGLVHAHTYCGISRHVWDLQETYVPDPSGRVSRDGFPLFLNVNTGIMYELKQVGPDDSSCGARAFERVTKKAWKHLVSEYGRPHWLKEPRLDLVSSISWFPRFIPF